MSSVTLFDKLLVATFIFICMLLGFRIYYSGTLQHIFLIWNIFLAWIPYKISYFFVRYENKQKWKQLMLFSTWLLFFPNALYIITDLIHLQEAGNAPIWFDAILLFTASSIGLLMAFMSLHNAEDYLSKKLSKRFMPIAIPFILFIASFGVYLGRFERWNSWDIFHSPVALGIDILECFLFPQEHYRSWGITILLSILFYLIYAFSKILPPSVNEDKGNAVSRGRFD